MVQNPFKGLQEGINIRRVNGQTGVESQHVEAGALGHHESVANQGLTNPGRCGCSDIVRQFLVECLVITTIGGLIGVGGGIAGARAISHYADWKTVVSGSAVLLSLCVSFSVGLIFGLYPAIRAASIEPMEALRAE